MNYDATLTTIFQAMNCLLGQNKQRFVEDSSNGTPKHGIRATIDGLTLVAYEPEPTEKPFLHREIYRGRELCFSVRVCGEQIALERIIAGDWYQKLQEMYASALPKTKIEVKPSTLQAQHVAEIIFQQSQRRAIAKRLCQTAEKILAYGTRFRTERRRRKNPIITTGKVYENAGLHILRLRNEQRCHNELAEQIELTIKVDGKIKLHATVSDKYSDTTIGDDRKPTLHWEYPFLAQENSWIDRLYAAQAKLFPKK